MGYYTSYNMHVKNVSKSELDDVIVPFLKQRGIADYALSPEYYEMYSGIIEFPEYDSVKWYEHDQDMTDLSLLLPDATFQLSGNGEEYGDMWEVYYRNGESEACRAFIPPPKRIKW